MNLAPDPMAIHVDSRGNERTAAHPNVRQCHMNPGYSAKTRD